MKNITPTIAFLFISLLFINFSNKENKISISGTKVQELITLDKTVSAFMDKWKIKGGSVALIKNGKLIYARAFGKANENESTKPNHLFRIASLSKPITSTAILKLIEQNKVGLNQFVFGPSGILNDPQFLQIKDERVKQITVQHLLQHTGGWNRETSPCGDPMFDPVNIAKCMNSPSPASSETVMRYMLTKTLDFNPGSKYSYSNFGYSILGRIIEKVTGTPYEEYIQSTILIPAGITGMELGKNLLCDKQSNEVNYYDHLNKKLTSVCEPGKTVAYPYGGFNLEAMDAHGGWLASSIDLAKFLVATDGKDSTDLLRGASAKLMFETSSAYKGYGNGWFVNANGNRWHTGCLPGTSAVMANLDKGLGWVILFNGNPHSEQYFYELDRLIWSALEKVNTWPKHDLFENFPA